MHQKRISAPPSWHIPKKTHVWASTPRPGPHSKERSIALLHLVRDMLGLAETGREARLIINQGSILVDGKKRRDPRFPVGLFDVISIPLLEKHYRLLLDAKGRLTVRPLLTETPMKLCRINSKKTLKGGRVQLNLHDGTNILGSDEYRSHDSLILSIPDKKIIKHLAYKPGSLVMVVGGQHSGETGTIKEIRKTRSSAPNTVSITGKYEFETIEDYIFVIGETEPEIDIGGEE